MKKVLSFVLTVTMLMNVFAMPAFAVASDSASTSTNINATGILGDIYAKKYSEKLIIDGNLYTYSYSYDKQGNRTIKIASGDTEDIVSIDLSTGKAYLNGDLVAYSKVSSKNLVKSPKISINASSWEYFESGEEYISWAEGLTAAALAGLIGGFIGGPVGAIVGVAGGIVASCTGGTLTWDSWIKYGSTTQVKVTWRFTAPDNSKFGPYTFTFKR